MIENNKEIDEFFDLKKRSKNICSTEKLKCGEKCYYYFYSHKTELQKILEQFVKIYFS